MEERTEAPYYQRGIMGIDDYEYNLVFQNEGDREVDMQLINKLKSQYPLDWSGQPPSSAHFQSGLQALKESFKNAPAEPSGENPYKEIEGDILNPPDLTSVEQEERKILQMYRPEKTTELGTYDVEDARDLITRVYKAKGLIPEVQMRQPNVYDIIGTRKISDKTVYEDDKAPATKAPTASAGEGTITVPPTAVDVAAGLDPYFSPTPTTHIGKWDYTKFTPGLERQFAPTYPTTEWY